MLFLAPAADQVSLSPLSTKGKIKTATESVVT